MIKHRVFIGFNSDHVIRWEDDTLHYLPTREDGYASQRHTGERNFFYKEAQVAKIQMFYVNQKIGYKNDCI